MTRDEHDALQKLGIMLLRHTVALTRTDSHGRGSGVVIPWECSHRVVTARHVIAQGQWAVEAVPPTGHHLRRESDLFLMPLEERQTLLLRLKADAASFDATTHDIAWAEFELDRGVLATDPTAALSNVPRYTGPLHAVPSSAELYTFVATNRDEAHESIHAVVREVAAEAFMTLLREESDGLRFALGREHQGDAYYRGSSGAPVADRTGAIIGVVSGGSAATNELVVAGLAQFIATMKVRG